MPAMLPTPKLWSVCLLHVIGKPSTKKIISNYGARKRTISLNTPGIYYWRVITKDNHGTSSDSGISTFTVLE